MVFDGHWWGMGYWCAHPEHILKNFGLFSQKCDTPKMTPKVLSQSFPVSNPFFRVFGVFRVFRVFWVFWVFRVFRVFIDFIYFYSLYIFYLCYKYFLSMVYENIFYLWCMKIFFIYDVWWKIFFVCDENIFCVMKIFFVCDENIFCVWWKYFLCHENIFCVWWKYFLCHENIFCVWWKYFLSVMMSEVMKIFFILIKKYSIYIYIYIYYGLCEV
jgi:hypothetical protein